MVASSSAVVAQFIRFPEQCVCDIEGLMGGLEAVTVCGPISGYLAWISVDIRGAPRRHENVPEPAAPVGDYVSASAASCLFLVLLSSSEGSALP